MAGQRIVRCNGRHGAGGFADFNGDVLTIGQGHDNRRTGHRRADSGGVSDGAAFSDRGVSRQLYGRRVDGISDVGHGWRGARDQVLEITARHILDGDFDFASVFIDVIGGRRNGHGASGFTSLDGDHRTVRQGNGDRRACGVGQGRGVGDLAAFSHGARRAQRQVGGVSGVGDGGADRGFVGNEVFVIAAAHARDRIGNRRVAGQRIVRCNGRHGAGGFADFNGDVLTIGQGHDNRRTGHRRADSGGVSDGAAFSDRGVSRQLYGRRVDGISDVGHGWRGARDQVLEITARHILDGDFDFASVFIDVIGGRRNGHGASGFTSLDGDHRTVRQGNGDRRACGVGQGRGVGDLAAFSHGARRAQRQVGGVSGVGDGGADRGFVGNEVFVIAAAHARDRIGNRRVAGQRIVRCNGRHGAGGFADFDSDVLTIGQSHDHRRTGHWGADSGGVGDGATFSGSLGGGQFHRRGINGIGHVGDGRNGARHQVLEVAASRVLDRDFDFAGVFVDVIGGRRNGHGASGFASLDGDHRAIAQGHGYRCAGRIGQRRGVNDRTTFGHGPGCRQRQVGVVDRVGNGGGRWRRVRHQIFEIATGSTGDGGADGAAIVVNVVGRSRHVDGASGLAGVNGDGRAVRQGDRHRSLRSIGQRRGVSDLAAFDDRTGGGKAHAGGVDRVGNGGGRRRGVRHQAFEVAAGSASNGGADGAAIVVDVIGRSRHVDGAGGLPSLNGDGRTVRQGDSHRGLRRVGQGRGVSDLATLDHSAGGGQGQVGGVDRIGDGGHRWRRVRHQVFEVTAAGTGNRRGDGAAIVIDVVGRGRHVDRAGGLAGADGDGRAVRQGDGHRGLRRVGQGRGVSDLPAFGDTRPGRQGDGGGVDGVSDLGCGRSGRRGHGDAIAAGGAGDGHVDLGRVVVNGVVRRQRHIDGASGCACRNHNHRAVGQGDGQVGQRRLGQGRGVHQHAAGFGDGRRGAEAQGRITQGVGGGVGGLAAGDVLRGLSASVDACSRETNGRVNAASGGVEHDEAVTTTGGTARACGTRAGSSGVQRGGRVDTGGDGLLQFGYRRRCLRSGLGQVSAGVRRVGAPLGFSAQIEGAAISQLKRHGAGEAGVDLVTHEQAIAFNEYATYTLRGDYKYLTDNAFDDGNNTAH
ncbi:hypothetical protein D3C84_42810 [compost metagenome]